MKSLQRTFRELLRYPSAVFGLLIITSLLLLSAYAIISIPYNEAIRLWRGGEGIWYKNPKLAAPEWTNFFRTKKLPKSIYLSTLNGTAEKKVTLDSAGHNLIDMTFSFDYPYDAFPQELTLFFTSKYDEKTTQAEITWVLPDGQTVRVAGFGADNAEAYYFSQDTKLQRRLKGVFSNVGLFMSEPSTEKARKSRSRVLTSSRSASITFEADSDLDAEFVLYGQVHGWAGTDHLRRDLGVALLWGTPIALAFGLLAALGTTITTMVIAAIGVWYGGWVDELIQRITEVNLVLPFLPILIMIGTFYSRSIWVILAVTDRLEHLWGGDQELSRDFPADQGIALHRGGACLWGGQWPDHLLLPDPAPDPAAHPCDWSTAIPGYVFLEASPGRAGLGRSRPAHLGKDHQRCPGQWRSVPGLVLLGAGARRRC